MGKEDTYVRATRGTTDFTPFRSQWDIATPDMYLKHSLMEGYIIIERLNGYAKLKIIWNGGQIIEGWLPEAFID